MFTRVNPYKKILKLFFRLYHLLLVTSGYNGFLTRCMKGLLKEIFFLRSLRNYKIIKPYVKQRDGCISRLVLLRQHAYARAVVSIWKTMLFLRYTDTIRHSDLRGIPVIKELIAQGKGVLLLAFHYGPPVYTYLLFKNSIPPCTLVGQNNITAFSEPEKGMFLEKDFLVNYRGVQAQGKSEKSFLQYIIRGGTGLVMMDVELKKNYRNETIFGGSYKIGTFPFRAAEKYNIPTAIVWFSVSKGGGVVFNAAPCSGTNAIVNSRQYAEILESIVLENCSLWWLLREHAAAKRGE